MLQVIPISALQDNYIWCIVHSKSNQCVIIDPGEAQPVLDMLKTSKLQLSAIFITHHHWDHTNGINELFQQFKTPIYGGANEKNIPHCQYPLNDKQIVSPMPDLQLAALAIPGHTLGHTAYYGHGLVFTGDTLFTGSCGRVFEGTMAQMLTSIQKLTTLPEETLVYCGHEYTQSNLRFAQAVEPDNANLLARIEETNRLREQNLPTVPSTLKLEKQTNPFLRTDQPAVIKAAENHVGRKLNNSVEVFTVLREWKNNF